ncbi:MAG: ATP-binding protein [Candidatus Sumerlaeota bacterium]
MALIAVLAGALLLGFLYVVQRILVRPVTEMASEVDHIAREADMSERVTPRGQAELRELARTINLMLTGLEQTAILLQESEKRLEKAQDVVKMGHWDAETGENWIWASRKVFELAGLEPNNQMRSLKQVLRLFSRPCRRQIFQGFRSVFYEGADSFEVDCPLVNARYDVIWMRLIANCDERNKRSLALSGTVQEITAQKDGEERLRQSEGFLRGIFAAIPDDLIVRNRALKILHSNRPVDKVTQGRAACGLDQCGHCRALDVVNSGVPLTFEVRDSLRAVVNQVRLFPVLDESGEVTMIVEHIVDITEQKQKAEEFEKIRAAVDDASEGIATLTPNGRVEYMNLALAEMLRHTRESLNEVGLQEVFVDTNDLQMILRTARNYESWTREVKLRNSNRQTRSILLRATPILDEHVEAIGVLLIASDETERRELERQLLQSQKLRSIGQMAAGIAHEINTPTQYVGDNLLFVGESFTSIRTVLDKFQELLESARNGDDTKSLIGSIEDLIEEEDMGYLCEEVPEKLRQSQEGIEHVARIVRAMKDFSHPGVEEKTQVDINRALESTATVARNEWKYVADLDLQLADDLPCVPCLAGEVNQAFLNLIVNAAHAIEERNRDTGRQKGRILIETRMRDAAVEVRISDDGSGIPESVQSHIFDPFFTTKDVGKGTGQGLSIVHSVITQKHDGQISFETVEGEGTSFIMQFPLNEKMQQEAV